ncbi:hypothetical protein ACFP1I_27820 [Dyadobacter subterraneus]|uniref:DUF5666 domain-containing protein n=1 Tax=Dyadobacter subterraneus TaxID=2773304 RepID=A0ABR9WCQ1_9BACT|nr:hypothetical protein [Dyadobacter subterraneus]MBE9463173.1 hypothetical protein [Dyadobacter subterraneus]
MKSKKFLIAAGFFATALFGLTFLNSCSGSKIFSQKGTVQNIEYGKDGYTAYLKDKNGKDFDAVISRVRMEKDYKVLKVGDNVALSGDTIHLDNKIRVLVKQIK